MDSFSNQVLALAGVFQSALYVERLARNGRLDTDDMARCIRSVLNLSPESVEAVYEGIEGNQAGLDGLIKVLAKRGEGVSPEVVRYAMGILHAQRKLSQRDDLMDALGKTLDRAVDQYRYFSDPMHEAVIAACAHCYQESVSKLNFRIRVMGNPSYLQNPQTADKVRALLLFGIRSAHLWHQQGGRRWHILIKRNKINSAAQALLARTRPTLH
ncbi:MAG: high frequency lysogenization protein HflD [Saccharospirillum sp.]